MCCEASFPGGSDGKEYTCDAGDPGSTPRLGRSPGGGHGSPLQYPGLENPHGQRNLAGYSPWVRKESDMTEQLNTAHSMCLSKFPLQLVCPNQDPDQGHWSGRLLSSSDLNQLPSRKILHWLSCRRASLLELSSCFYHLPCPSVPTFLRNQKLDLKSW